MRAPESTLSVEKAQVVRKLNVTLVEVYRYSMLLGEELKRV